MSQSPSVSRNYIWNTINQVFILLVPLILTPYLSRVLGADGIGIYSYVNSIASYFIITAILGTTLYGQRSIACVRNNKEECSKVFWEIQIFRMLASTICLAFFFIVISFIKENILIYFILSINIVNVIFDISWFYYGIEDFKKIAIRNFMVKILNMVFIFVFINDSSDLWLYAASIVGFSILGNASMWFGLPKILVKVDDVHPLKNIKDIILLFLPTMATQVYCVLDKSMIGWITGSSYQNGCYEQAEKVARFSLSIVTSIAMVVLPRVANLFKNQMKDDVLFYIYKAYRFTTFLAFPIMFGLIGVAGTFVPVFFGEGYDLVEVLMPIFSILVVAVSLAYLTGYSYLISTKQQNVYTFSVAIAAVCNLAINFVLIPRIGAVGAAIASVSAEIIGVSIQIGYCCLSHQLELKKIFEGAFKYLVSAFLMLLVLLTVQKYLPTTVLGLLALIATGVAAYSLMLFIFKDDFFRNNVKMVFRKFISVKSK